MSISENCPEPENLRRMAGGKSSDTEISDIIEHLDDCVTCRNLFESFLRLDARALSPRDTDIPSPPSMSTELGSRFQVIETLGTGGMGSVVKCFDTRLGRIVAVKIVRMDRISADHLQRVDREARAQASLNHPNIVPIYEIGLHAGLPMIVMEYLPGGSLKDLIAGNPLAPNHAARVLAGIARGLDHAHNAGIIHRDLKPSNILLSSRDPGSDELHPKIADFGLAKFMSENSDLTATDVIPGTPAYIAPEQVDVVEKQSSPASDIYALGVILYECLTGRPPFTGASVAQIVSLISHAAPVSPRELTAGISRDLETICLKCLQKNPAHRYSTALALAHDLDSFLAGRPIQARPVPPLTRGWRWCMRNRRLAAALGVAIVSLVSLAVGGVAVAISQAKLRQLANQNGQLAIAQARKAAELEKEALSQRDQARLQFVESSRALHDIGSMLSVFQFSPNNEIDLKAINREFQKKVLELSLPYLNRPDIDTDSPELLPLSIFNAARAYDQLGNEAEAIRHFERLLELTHRTAPPPYAAETFRHLAINSSLELAEIHKRAGRFDQAIALIEPFWSMPVDPVTKRPPDPTDPNWARLRTLFGTKLRELYEWKGMQEEARRIDEEIHRTSVKP